MQICDNLLSWNFNILKIVELWVILFSQVQYLNDVTQVVSP